MTNPEKTSKILRLFADGLSIETVSLMVGVSERFVKHIQSNSKDTAMFKITDCKGFHMTFENGWTISVQFGYGNYCENYNNHTIHKDTKVINERYADGIVVSKDAEIAIIDPSGEMIDLGGDAVKGRVSTDEVAQWIQKISSITKATQP